MLAVSQGEPRPDGPRPRVHAHTQRRPHLHPLPRVQGALRLRDVGRLRDRQHPDPAAAIQRPPPDPDHGCGRLGRVWPGRGRECPDRGAPAGPQDVSLCAASRAAKRLKEPPPWRGPHARWRLWPHPAPQSGARRDVSLCAASRAAKRLKEPPRRTLPQQPPSRAAAAPAPAGLPVPTAAARAGRASCRRSALPAEDQWRERLGDHDAEQDRQSLRADRERGLDDSGIDGDEVLLDDAPDHDRGHDRHRHDRGLGA